MTHQFNIARVSARLPNLVVDLASDSISGLAVTSVHGARGQGVLVGPAPVETESIGMTSVGPMSTGGDGTAADGSAGGTAGSADTGGGSTGSTGADDMTVIRCIYVDSCMPYDTNG